MGWLAGKSAIMGALGISQDALHLHGGIVVYLALAWLFDRRVRSARALIAVAVLLIAWAGGDWLAYRATGKILTLDRMWPGIVAGLCWPVLLYLAGPWLQATRAPAGPPRG